MPLFPPKYIECPRCRRTGKVVRVTLTAGKNDLTRQRYWYGRCEGEGCGYEYVDYDPSGPPEQQTLTDNP